MCIDSFVISVFMTSSFLVTSSVTSVLIMWPGSIGSSSSSSDMIKTSSSCETLSDNPGFKLSASFTISLPELWAPLEFVESNARNKVPGFSTWLVFSNLSWLETIFKPSCPHFSSPCELNSLSALNDLWMGALDELWMGDICELSSIVTWLLVSICGRVLLASSSFCMLAASSVCILCVSGLPTTSLYVLCVSTSLPTTSLSTGVAVRTLLDRAHSFPILSISRLSSLSTLASTFPIFSLSVCTSSKLSSFSTLVITFSRAVSIMSVWLAVPGTGGVEHVLFVPPSWSLVGLLERSVRLPSCMDIVLCISSISPSEELQ